MTHLKNARLRKGITRLELERRAGLKPRSLEPYEQGARRFSAAKYSIVTTVARILEADPEDLI